MYVDQNTDQYGAYFRSVYSLQLQCYEPTGKKKKKGKVEISEISERDGMRKTLQLKHKVFSPAVFLSYRILTQSISASTQHSSNDFLF